jgi:hypothetical protein
MQERVEAVGGRLGLRNRVDIMKFAGERGLV